MKLQNLSPSKTLEKMNTHTQATRHLDAGTRWHAFRVFVRIIGVVMGASALAVTTSFPIPSFTEQVLVPASTTMVWVPPTTQNVWVPPSTTQVWVPPVTRTELVPDQTSTIVHPAITDTINHPPVTMTVAHPAVYDVIHHDIQIGVRHHEEQGYVVHHEAVTRTVQVEGYWNEYSVEGYWDWAWIDGWWSWEVVDYEGNLEDWVWHEGYHELVWTAGFTDYDWVEGYSYDVTDAEAWDEWVVEVPAHDEYYIISPAYNEYIEISAAWIETITLQEARTEIVVLHQSWTEVIVLSWKTVVFTDVEGRWVTQEVPGRWEAQTVPGWWDSVTLPAYFRTDIVAASTLTVESNDQNVIGATWSTGRTVSVQPWIHDFLNNPNWSLDEPDDDEGSAEFTMAYAFQSVQTAQRMRTLPAPPRRIGKENGKWGTVETATAGAMTAEEAIGLISIYLLSEAIQVTTRRQNPKPMVYIVYEKLSMDTTPPRKVYTGRTSGWGDVDAVVARREARHAVTRPNFWLAIPNSITIMSGWSQEAYGAMRGREQSVMDWHDLHAQPLGDFGYSYSYSHSENARPTATRAHGTRGVDPNNRRAYDFHDVAKRAFYGDEIWRFTGLNPTNYEYLDWPPLPDRAQLLLPAFARPPLIP